MIDQFRFGSIGLKTEDFRKHNSIVQLGVQPNRIDIITGVEALIFSEAYKNKQSVQIDNISIDIVSIEDLRKNKLAIGRDKDKDDISHLP